MLLNSQGASYAVPCTRDLETCVIDFFILVRFWFGFEKTLESVPSEFGSVLFEKCGSDRIW